MLDLHMHSTFSADARDGIGAMCRAAVAKGLRFICFTEHLDLDPADHGYGFFRRPAYLEAVTAARREFAPGLTILSGLEVGEPHEHPREFAAEARQGYDMIMGSIHMVYGPFVGEPQLREQYDAAEIYDEYYRKMLAAVEHGGFDVLGHLDFPKRYLGEGYDAPSIDQILAALVRQGIAIEINTSSLRKGLAEPMPGPALVARYIRQGGERITIGSDAHSVPEVGADIAAAAAIPGVRERLGYFRERRFVKIENFK